MFENDGLRMWHDGDGIAVVSFKTKMNTVSDQVLDGLQECVSRAEKDFQGLVIWQQKASLPVPIWPVHWACCRPARSTSSKKWLPTSSAPASASSTRWCRWLPPCVAWRGGGCEFQMHSAKTVASLESYIGLVEAGVGLLPAGGGQELAVRASRRPQAGGDVFAELKKTFETVAMAKVSNSAVNAKELLRSTDKVVFNSYEALHIAKPKHAPWPKRATVRPAGTPHPGRR